MSDNTWAYTPIPLTTGSIVEEEMLRERRDKALRTVEKIPFYKDTPDYAAAFESPLIFQDIDSGEIVRGMMHTAEASRQQMKTELTRGFTSRDKGFQQMVSQQAVGGRDLEKYENTILDLTDAQEEILTSGAEGPQWNLEFWNYSVDDIPIYDLAVGGPEDILNDEPPEGWSVDSAIEVFKESDPELYNIMSLSLGGDSGIAEIVKDARNPMEFFVKLQQRQQLLAITESQQEFDRRSGWFGRQYEWGKNFIVNGILDDPDMAGSIALSLGLLVTTGGIGTVGAIAAKVGQTALRGYKFAKAGRAARVAGRALATSAKYGRQAQHWMPENLGPTLVKSVLFKNRYQSWSGLKRFSVNRLADSAEGTISGGIAEFFNQNRMKGLGITDDISYTSVLAEAAVEAMVSPMINPGMGQAMKLVGAVSAVPGTLGAMAWEGTIGKTELGEFLGTLGEKTISMWNPDSVITSMDAYDKKEEIFASMNSLLVEGESVGKSLDENELLAGLLETLKVTTELDDLTFLDKINGALGELILARDNATGTQKKMTGLELAIGLANQLATKDQDIKAAMQGDNYTEFMSVLGTQVTIAQNARRENKTIDEYLDDVNEKGNYFDLLPDVLKERVYKENGGKAVVDKLTDKAKREKAAEIQLEIVKKTREVHNNFQDRTDEQTNKIEKIESDAKKVARKHKVNPPVITVVEEKTDTDLTDTDLADTEEEAIVEKEPSSGMMQHQENMDKIKKGRAELRRVKEELKKKHDNASDADAKEALETDIKEIDNLLSEMAELSRKATESMNVYLRESGQDKKLIELGRTLSTIVADVKKFETDKVKPWEQKMHKFAKPRLGIQQIQIRFMRENFKEEYPDGLRYSDLNSDEQAAINDAIEVLEGRGSKYLERVRDGEKISIKQLKQVVERIGNRMKKIHDDFEKSSEGREWADHVEKQNRALADYQVAFAQYQQENMVSEVIRMAQVRGIAETQKLRRAKEAQLKGMRKTVDQFISEHVAANPDTPISAKQVIDRLPRWSKLRKKLESNRNKGESSINVAELKTMIDEDFADMKKNIRVGKQDPRYRRFKRSDAVKDRYKGRFANEVSDSEILDVDYDQDWLVQNIEIGSPVKSGALFSIEQDSKAFAEFKANLSDLSNTVGAIDNEGTISAWRLTTNMPEYFWDLGLPLHLIFREAMIDPEGTEGASKKGIATYWSGNEEFSHARFDYATVMKILNTWQQITKSRLEGIVADHGKNIASELLEELLEEGSSSNLPNLHRTVEFLNNVIEADRIFNKERFEADGFILTVDEETGFPASFAKQTDGHRFVGAVKKAIHQRVEVLMGRRKYREALRGLIGLDPKKKFERESPEALNSRIAQETADITSYIMSELSDLLNTVGPEHLNYIEYTIEGFGNGEISWSSPKQAGDGIVDTIIGKLVPEKSRLSGVGEVPDIPTTESRVIGQSVRTAAPLEADTNAAAPVPTWEIRRAVENHKFRLRVREVLKRAESGKPLTQAEKDILYNKAHAEYKESRLKDKMDPVADEMDVYVVPQIIGGHLQERIMTRGEAKEFMLEIFLDMAHVSYSFIQDAQTIANGGTLRFKNTAENPQPLAIAGLNVGYDNIVPWGRLGETLALEEMSPNLKGMTETVATAHLAWLAERKEKWLANNPGKEWNINEILSDSNQIDQVGSGLQITTLLSRIGDEGVARQLGEIEALLAGDNENRYEFLDENGDAKVDEDGNFISLALEDIYVNSGLGAVAAMRGKHSDNEFIQGSGQWNTVVFKWLADNNINTAEDFRNALATMEGQELKKAKACREFFKIPVLRRLYGGGLDSWKLEFIGANPRSREKIKDLEAAFADENLKFTDEELLNLGKSWLGHAGKTVGHILDAAMGFEGTMRKKAMSFYTQGRSSQMLSEAWRDIVQSTTIPARDSETAQGAQELVGEDGGIHVMDRIERVKRDLDAKLDWLAERMPGDPDKNRIELEEKYQDRWGKAREFIEEVERKGENLNDGSPNWERLQEILHGNTMSWENIRLFRATNILNASAYSLNMQRMKQVANDFGFPDFDPEDWMGLENQLLFHLNLPTQRSPRSYSVGGLDTHGIFANRVAVNPEKFTAFMQEAKERVLREEGREFTREDFEEALGDWLENRDPDAMGMFDMKDNIFKGETREDVDAELDRLMDIDQLLYMAGEDTLDPKLFPDYHAESSEIAVIDSLNRMWYEHNEKRFRTPEGETDRTIASEIEFEERMLASGEHGRAILLNRAKILGGYRSSKVAKAMGGAKVEYHRREYSASEAIGTKEEHDLYMSTVAPQGPLSLTPKYKRMSYFNRGIPALQREGVQRQINEVMAPIARIDPTLADTAIDARVGDTTNKGVSIFEDHPALLGWKPPWKRENLPMPRPIRIDELLELNIDDEIGRKAVTILQDMREWASLRPDVLEDLESPEGLIYWYVTREIERLRESQLNDLPAYDDFNTTEEEGLAYARRYREKWLKGLHDLTHFSRDIKYGSAKGYTLSDSARELSVQAAKYGEENITEPEWLELLTSRMSENNPRGIGLSSPTRLDKALSFILPRENVILINKLGQNGAKIETNELKMLAQLIQSTDFNLHLLSVLYTNEILPSVLKEFTVTLPDGSTVKPYADKKFKALDSEGNIRRNSKGEVIELAMWEDPNLWEQYIDPSHIHAIIAQAKEWVKKNGKDDIVFDTLIETQITSDPKVAGGKMEKMKVHLASSTPDAVGGRQGSKLMPHVMGGSVFRTVNTQTEVTGKGTLALTPDKALELFAYLESMPVIMKSRRSQWGNIALGFERDPVTGLPREVQPVSRSIEEGLGHSEREIREAEIKRSNALERIIATKEETGINVRMVADETRTTEGGAIVQVVDLDHYSKGDHAARMGRRDSWFESFLSPIEKQIGYLKATNIHSGTSPALLAQLESVVEGAREANLADDVDGDLNAAVAMWLGIMLQLDDWNKFIQLKSYGPIFKTFIGQDRFSKATNAEAFAQAKKLARQIRQVAGIDWRGGGLTGQRHTNLINAIREWASHAAEEEGLNAELSPSENFKQWVAENRNTVRKSLGIDVVDWESLGFTLENDELVFEGIGDSRDPDVPAEEELRYIVEYAIGKELLDVEQDSNITTFETDESRLNSTGKDLIRLVKDPDEFRKAVNRTGDMNLRRVASDLDGLEGQVSPRNLERLRALVSRMWAINPMNLLDLEIGRDFVAREGKPRVKRSEDGKFVIRMGNKLDTPLNDPNVALVFAHELSHMGRMKWVADNSGTWRQWVDLYHSKAGRTLLAKIVQAWHGGQWTAVAEQEYNSYLKDPEEFIAALTSYYLVNDSLPALELDENEGRVLGKADSIIDRILDFVRQHFLRVASVLTNFHYEDPKLAGHVESLIQKTLGWDPEGKKAFTEIQNEGTTREMFWDKRFEDPANDYIYSLDELQTKIKEHSDLAELGEDRDDAQDSRFLRLDEELNDPRSGADHMLAAGLSRYDYEIAHAENMERFAGPNGTLDLSAMMKSIDTSRGDAVNMTSMAAALQYAMTKLDDTYGAQFRQGGGVVLHKIMKAATMMLSMGHGDPVKWARGLADLTVGKTGANHTWNGPHPFEALLTMLINDDIATTIGQYTNVRGTPSVNRNVVGMIATYQERIIASQTKITNLLQPWMTKFLGHEAHFTTKAKERSAKIWDAVYFEIMRKTENPNHEVELSKLVEDGMGVELAGKIKTEIENIALSLSKFMQDYMVAGKELGVISEHTADDTHTLPYKMTKRLNEYDARSGFMNNMGTMLQDKIINTEELIDPVVMYCGGLLPRFDTLKGLKNDLEEIKNVDNGSLFQMIAYKAAEAANKAEGKDIEDRAIVAGRKQAVVNQLYSADDHVATNALEHFRQGVLTIMREMGHKRLTVSELKNDHNINWDAFKDRYERAASKNHVVQGDRIQALDSPALDAIVPDSIHYSPGRTTARKHHVMKIRNAVDLHLHNLMNRASAGMYYTWDMWSMPTVLEAASDPVIRPHLILSPRDIMDDMKKGRGDKMFERQMMVDEFNIFGDVSDLLNLFETVASRGPGETFYNYDGTPVSRETQNHMVKSAQVLRGKHDVTRGIKHSAEGPSSTENIFMQMAPGITRTVFGGNLAMATATVEGMMNVLQEALGKGNIVNALRGIFAPILGLSREGQERVARDLVHTVEALTKGHLPDHEMPANAIQQNWAVKAVNFTGRQAMRPAQHMLKTIAMSRAVSARNFITDNLLHKTTKGKDGSRVPRLERLAQLIRDEPLGDDPKALRDRMRKAGFGTILAGDLPLISYMLRAGVLNLEDGSFDNLQSMVKEGTQEHRYYSPGEMLGKLHRSGLEVTDPEYQSRKKIISGLRFIEKGYIEEVLVAPNAFDIFTPMVSKTGEVSGVGAMDTLFEIFRRYPMLFVSQHIYRKANRLDFTRFAFGAASMIMLDMVYMLALRLAMGAYPEDIWDEFEKNPVQFTMLYASRLPILGRYMGFLAEATAQVTSMAQGRTTRQPGGFVPTAAVFTALGGGLKAGQSWLDDEPHKWQDTINAARVVPLLGEGILRLGIYTAAGDSITRRKHSSGGGGSGSGSGAPIHYGVTSHALNQGYNVELRKLLEEFSGQQLRWPQYEAQRNMSIPFRDTTVPEVPKEMEGMTPPPRMPSTSVPEPAPAPASPPVPAPTSVEPDMVDRLRGQQGTSGKLADALG